MSIHLDTVLSKRMHWREKGEKEAKKRVQKDKRNVKTKKISAVLHSDVNASKLLKNHVKLLIKSLKTPKNPVFGKKN